MTATKCLTEKVLGVFGNVSGGAAIISAHNVCHTLCMIVIAALSIIGVTVSGMPLLWMQKYALTFWLMGIGFLGLNVFMHIQHHRLGQHKSSNNMMIAIVGLLVAGVPFQLSTQRHIFLWIVGGGIVAFAIYNYVKHRIARKKEENEEKNSMAGRKNKRARENKWGG